jgi:hypothetical protein
MLKEVEIRATRIIECDGFLCQLKWRGFGFPVFFHY